MKKPNDQQKYKYDIMISYCSADKDIVHNVQQFLVNEGYNIWSERNHNNEQGKVMT
jgi:formyltetrahydrofolate hydrolase